MLKRETRVAPDRVSSCRSNLLRDAEQVAQSKEHYMQ
jgi:hypothetical protein